MSHQRNERRHCRRLEMSCPLVVSSREGAELFQIRTQNISDSGLYIETPASNLPAGGVPDEVHLQISVPRSTPNTFMLEPFGTYARVIRSEPLANADMAGLAIEFDKPVAMDLMA